MTSMTIRSRTLIAVCLAGLLGGGAAVAQTAQDDAPQAPAVDQSQAQEAVAQTDTADKKRQADRNCLRDTGSRIRARDPATGKRPCMAGPGTAYSKDDLDRTGQVDLGRALNQLDPSISGH